MLNLRAACSAYRDHVESHRILSGSVAAREYSGGAPNLRLLAGIDRLAWRSRRSSDAALDLDEDQRLIVHRDQVNFRSRGAKIPRQDAKSPPLQVTFRELLALFADRNSRGLSAGLDSVRKPELPQ